MYKMARVPGNEYRSLRCVYKYTRVLFCLTPRKLCLNKDFESCTLHECIMAADNAAFSQHHKLQPKLSAKIRNDVKYYIGTLLGDVDERFSFQVIEYGAPYPLGNGASVGHFPVDCSSPPLRRHMGMYSTLHLHGWLNLLIRVMTCQLTCERCKLSDTSLI